jgi:uncharacterized protein
MLIHEMTEDECRAELGRTDFGRLACVRDGDPYIVPVNFSYDGQYLYGITTLGQKIEWMRSNPLVCLEIDERPDPDHWMSVIVFGRYEEIPDTPKFQAVRAHAYEVLQKRTIWWEPACIPNGEGELRPPIFYRIEIEQMTGRRGMPRASGPR